MRAPVSRSRPPSRRRSRALVADQPLVGGLGLRGELAFGLAHRVVAAPRPARGSGVFRGAGGQLEPAQLLLGQRWLLMGIVLAAPKHAPDQDRELAGRRDDRVAVARGGRRRRAAGPVAESRSRPLRPTPTAPPPTRAWRSGRCAPDVDVIVLPDDRNERVARSACRVCWMSSARGRVPRTGPVPTGHRADRS